MSSSNHNVSIAATSSTADITTAPNLNQIGLNDVSAVIDRLNVLLSSYHVFYTNVRGYHWNIKGEHFFSLHAKFEELYNEIQIQIDEIAERILTLSGVPFHAYSDFAKHAFIEEHKNVFTGKDCVAGIVSSMQKLINEQRQLADMAEDIGDKGSADLVTAYYQQQEKHVWMYGAFLAQ